MTGQGLENLLQRIDAAMPVDPLMRLTLRLPVADGRSLSLVQGGGRVLHSELKDGHLVIEAEIPESLARKLAKFALAGSAAAGPGAAEFEM
jgi:GTPase